MHNISNKFRLKFDKKEYNNILIFTKMYINII